ncbi:MAG: hypothetical protein WCK46_01285 [Candidatus Adlerbacteria bacterium]
MKKFEGSSRRDLLKQTPHKAREKVMKLDDKMYAIAVDFLAAAWSWEDPEKAERLLEELKKNVPRGGKSVISACRRIFDRMKKNPGTHILERNKPVRKMRDLLLD